MRAVVKVVEVMAGAMALAKAAEVMARGAEDTAEVAVTAPAPTAGEERARVEPG